MGVMLTLDKPIARLRRRGQHTRTPEEQACLDAFAAFLRYDAPSAGRSLSRLATTVLASRLLPAARALADAVDLVLADQPLAAQAAGALPLPAHPLPARPLTAQPLAAPLSSDAAAYDRAAYDSAAYDSAAYDSAAYDSAAYDSAAHDSAAHSGARYDSAARQGPGRGSGPPGARTVALNFTVSPPCLLGVCRDGACRSPLCEHACHSRPA
jgi:hypothetical protein